MPEETPWFDPALANLIDPDILESGARAHLMDSALVQLQLAREIRNLADSLKQR